MQKVIEPSLKNLEFESDVATRWWPLGRAKGVVVDPKRQFGQPIDDATGVPTSVLAQAAQPRARPPSPPSGSWCRSLPFTALWLSSCSTPREGVFRQLHLSRIRGMPQRSDYTRRRRARHVRFMPEHGFTHKTTISSGSRGSGLTRRAGL